MYLGGLVEEGEVEFAHGVELHVGAVVACTGGILGRSGDEGLAGTLALHLMKDSALGGHDEFGGIGLDGPVEEDSCGSNLVGHQTDGGGTLGMHQHLGSGMLLLEFKNLFERELLMYVASSVPEHHVATGLGVDIISQIAVGTEDDFLVLGERLDHLHGVARGDHDVGESLDRGRGVDVGNHRVSGVLLDEFFKLGSRAAVGQRTPGVEVGNEDLFLRTKDLDGLAHEVDSAHHDDVVVESFGNPGEGERVAHKVGHILDLAHGVVMREDDGVLLFLESEYFLPEVDPFGDRCLHVAVFDFHLFIFEKNFFEKEFNKKKKNGCKYVQ